MQIAGTEISRSFSGIINTIPDRQMPFVHAARTGIGQIQKCIQFSALHFTCVISLVTFQRSRSVDRRFSRGVVMELTAPPNESDVTQIAQNDR